MSEIPTLVDPDTVEERRYQKEIFENIKEKDSLVVLPTGLGKTIIAVYLICYRLERGKRAVMMAPSRPLCRQHMDLLMDLTELERGDVELVTGELYSPKEREELWEGDQNVFVATPQVINNDLHKIPLSSIGLMIFDEVHKATGDYAYVEIAKACKDKMQFMGLTASPGTSFEQIVEVGANLEVEQIEVRTESDVDVDPYTADKIFEWTKIDKSDNLVEMEKKLDHLLNGFLQELTDYTKQAGGLESEEIGKSVLLDIQDNFKKRIKEEKKGYLFHAMSLTSASIKIAHLKELLVSQGIEAAHRYYLKLLDDESRAAKYVTKKDEFKELGEKLLDLKTMPIDTNPKIDESKRLLKEEIGEGKAMVFAQYRDTVEYLVENLEKIDGINPSRLVGQSDRENDKGMSQEEQERVLEEFSDGDTNVLVSTSIGEEGLDIPGTELVIFYEPVPSAIRSIQRKGRTGRGDNPGKVHVLLTEDSLDESYYWKSRQDEKKMYQHVYELKTELEESEEPKEEIRSLKEECVSDKKTLEDL